MLTAMSLTLDLDFDSETLKKYINMLTLIHDSRVEEEQEEDRKRKERMKKDRKEIVHKPAKQLKPTPSELPTIVEAEPKAESESDSDSDEDEKKETKEEPKPKEAPQKVKCECGMEVIKKNLKRHMTSKTHINNLKK
jgi:hypothetical protein